MRSIGRRSARRIHRRGRIRTIVLTLGLALPLRADAQEPVTLAQVLEAVEHGNPRLAAARALARAAEARVPGARRLPDPQLQVGWMNYTLPRLAPMDPLGMRQLQLMQMLPLGGKLRLAGEAAGADASAASLRADDIAWEVRSRGAMTFHDLLAVEARLAVSRETLRLLQDIARTAEAMYRVGEGRQADVLRAQVEIARMAGDTTRMQAMRTVMLAELRALAGDGIAPGPALRAPALPDSVPSLERLLAGALADRPMVRSGAEELRAADARARLARREVLPDLQLGIQLARGSATMVRIDDAGMPMRERRTESMGSLMIGAALPIYARDRQHQMRTEAEAMRAMAAAELAAMRHDTHARVVAAHAALVRARSLSALYRTTVLPQAQATVSSSAAAYRAGSVDFMTLLDNQMTVNRYREELATLQAEEGKAWAELEMLTGRRLIDAGSVRRNPGGAR